jgi:hypothetical protein
MTARILGALLLIFGLSGAGWASLDHYDGPRPPKPDVPYLVHANNLVETESGVAQDSQVKDKLTHTLAGVSSPARTPMAEPILVVEVQQLQPQKLQLYRLETKGGQRVIEFNTRKPKDNPRPLRFSVTRVGDGLFLLEAQETLDPGQYCLSPSGAQQVYCFEVF